MPAQLSLSGFDARPRPTEEQLLAAYRRSNLAMSFDRAMKAPAIAAALAGWARVMAAHKRRGGGRR